MSLPSTARAARSGLATTPTKKVRAGAFDEDAIGPLGVLFLLLLTALAVAILDYGVLPPVYAERSKPPYNVYARQDFLYNDPDELNRERDEAAERAPRVYAEDPAWVDNVLGDLTELAGIARDAKNAASARDQARRYPHDVDLVEQLYKYNEQYKHKQKTLGNPLQAEVLGPIRASLQSIAKNGILTREDLEFERNKRGRERREIIRLPSATTQEGPAAKPQNTRVPLERLRDAGGADDEFRLGSWGKGLPSDLTESLYLHIHIRLSQFPNNLRLDKTLTDQQQEQAREKAGRGDVPVRKHSLILSRDRGITKADLERLYAENVTYKAELPWEARARHLAALAAVVFTVLVVFMFAVQRVQPGCYRKRRALVMLGLLALIGLAAARGLLLAGASLALAPFVIVGMTAALAFGQTVALLTLFGLCILSTFAGVHWYSLETLGGLPTIGLALMAGGVTAALPAERLKDRLDLLKYGLLGGMVQGLSVAGVSLLGAGLSGPSISDAVMNGNGEGASAFLQCQIPTLRDALMALVNGPVCGLLVLGGLPLIESLFGILTNIRLFELADMNQPALRRIQLEAPGTFAHTLQVRFLAEPAAAAIGANTRLVSAGVLYHDLGKVLKPEYFIENQMDAPERHGRLRPSVSALLITAHVKDGIDLAQEYRLPQQIVEFIPEHHGTTLVSYFYHSAKKNAESGAGGPSGPQTVQESFFRYPGPKPRSRETAIVMLADTVEAATRTLSAPNAARLAGFTHELVMEKVLDGQLDECGLTFAELALIEEAFRRVLITRFHARIRYPGQGGDDEHATDGSKTTVLTPVLPGADAPPAPAKEPRPSSARDAAARQKAAADQTAAQGPK